MTKCLFKLFIWKVFNLLHLTIMALSPSYKHTCDARCCSQFMIGFFSEDGLSVELEFKTLIQSFCLQSCCHPPLHLHFLHYLPLVHSPLSLFLAFQSQRGKIRDRSGILKHTQTDNKMYFCLPVYMQKICPTIFWSVPTFVLKAAVLFICVYVLILASIWEGFMDWEI